MDYIIHGSSTASPVTTLTYNHPCAVTSSAWNSTENTSKYVFTSKTRILNLVVDLVDAPTAGQSRTYTIYKNGSSTGITVTIADGATQAYIDNVVVDFDVGDYMTLAHTSSAAPAAPTRCTWAMLARTLSKSYTFAGALNATLINDGTRRYWYPVGPKAGSALQTTDVINGRFYFANNCTIKSLYVGLTVAAGSGGTWIISIYKNGSEEASSQVSITGVGVKTGSVTGLNISISAGDYISISSIDTGSPSNTAVDYTAMEIVPEVDGEVTYCGVADNVTATTTLWSAPAYPGVGGTTTNENLRLHIIPPNARLVTRKFKWILTTAPGAAASGKARTLTVRKNSADANNTVTISETATTGEDLTHIDVFEPLDFISCRSVGTATPATSDIAQYFIGFVQPIYPRAFVI